MTYLDLYDIIPEQEAEADIRAAEQAEDDWLTAWFDDFWSDEWIEARLEDVWCEEAFG